MRTVRLESGTQRRARMIDVLIVEDDADCREMLAEVLLHERMAVRACDGGASALFALDVRAPDVVITDLAMPRMDGLDLARALRADPRFARVPIVATSGRVDPHWAVVRFFDAYLRKPIDLRLLPDLIRMLADSPRRARGAIA